MSFALCTTVTTDYLPQVLVLLKSARASGISASFYCFISDADCDLIASVSHKLKDDFNWIKFFGPDSLSHTEDLFKKAISYYNGLELSCLAKWVCVDYILETFEHDACIFADADMLFYKSLDDILNDSDCTLLVTPHQTKAGACSVQLEHDTLLHGTINSGFFILYKNRKSYREIVTWMISRVSTRGFLAPHAGMSGDQTWLSLVSVLFYEDTHVLMNPGLNVAYWNLAERRLSGNLADIRVNTESLIFFHFSGFPKDDRRKLSSHSDILVAQSGLLSDLCEHYREQLRLASEIVEKFKSKGTYNFNRGSLQSRLLAGSAINKTNLHFALRGTGIFSRVGAKFDKIIQTLAPNS